MTARIAILASGGGTTAEAFIRHSLSEHLDQTVVLVIVSRSEAGIITRLAALNHELGLEIPHLVINARTHPSTDTEAVGKGGQTKAEEQAILDVLETYKVDLVALLGYMKKVGTRLVTAYGWRTDYVSPHQARMVNSHPGPLPQTRALYGQGVQQHILDLGIDHGCQTLHVVAEDYDDGPILAEHGVPVEPKDTAETLFARIQLTEKEYVARDINTFWHEQQRYMRLEKVKQETLA